MTVLDHRRPGGPRRTANGTRETAAPLHDNDAEMGVLGAMLLSPAATTEAAETLDGTEFYRPAHETIYRAILALHATGERADAVTLAHALTNSGDLNRIGGAPYLHALMGTPLTAANVGKYAQIVAEHYRRRRLAEIGARISQMARDSAPEDLDAILDAARAQLEFAPRARPAADSGPIDWTALWAAEGKPVDLMAAGLVAAGKMTLLYSPGKTGKSLLAQEIAVDLACGIPCLGDPARTPLTVLYIDQEMTPDDWRDRLSDMRILSSDDLSNLVLYQLHPWPPFDSPEGGAALAKTAAKHAADLVIIDTLSKTLAGPENDNDTHQAFYRHTLVPLKRDGRAALILDHTGKDLAKGARGGSAKTDNIDLAFELVLRGKDLLTARRTHARFRHSTEYLYIRRATDPLLHQRETLDDTVEHAIAACIRHIEMAAPGPEASAREVLERVKAEFKTGYRKATFDAAYARFRGAKGWTA